jgi:hypothetical protein
VREYEGVQLFSEIKLLYAYYIRNYTKDILADILDVDLFTHQLFYYCIKLYQRNKHICAPTSIINSNGFDKPALTEGVRFFLAVYVLNLICLIKMIFLLNFSVYILPSCNFL